MILLVLNRQNNTNIVKYYDTKINKLQLDEDEEEKLK